MSILTTQRSGYTDEEINGVAVYRAGHNTLKDKLYNLRGANERRNEVTTSVPQSGLLNRLTEWVVDKTWRKNYWPDGSQLFLKPGIEKGKEIIANRAITHIVSVGLPFTCHWIAKSLKQASPNVHWHMDIQDPFCYSKEFWVNNFEKYAEKNKKAEALTFELADSISLTNEKAKDRYAKLFSGQSGKMTVMPPLFHNESAESSYDMQLYPAKIHLGYFGSFYDGVRSPLLFLKFLKYLHAFDETLFDKIQFHFVGQMDRNSYPMFDLYPEIRRFMVLHGFKNRSETLSAMQQVDIVMNFGNSTDYHLPSKVVDFLHVGKPILNLTSIEEDSTQLFLGSYPDIYNLKLRQDAFLHQARLFIEFVFMDRSKGDNPSSIDLSSYTLETIAAQYQAALTFSDRL